MANGYGRSNEGFGITRQESVALIVKTAVENGVTDPRQIAYMLATAQHETRNFTAPDEDFGRQQARKLGYRGGEEYFGRGYVHLTHIENYCSPPWPPTCCPCCRSLSAVRSPRMRG